MPAITPFRGLCYEPGDGGRDVTSLTAPPYDTVGPEARAALGAEPRNIVHVDLSSGRPQDDTHANQYTRAASVLETWRHDGVLVPTREPSTYPYEMTFELHGVHRRIRGVIAAVDLAAWGAGVHPHEEVMSGPVEDRLRLLRAVRANLSPVYGLIAGPHHGLDATLDEATAGPAALEAVDPEGTRHRLWIRPGPLDDPPDHEPLLIADGHHRYTTALRYRDEMRAANGPGPWDRLMMLVVDAGTEHPPVLPIHRISSSDPGPLEARPVRSRAEALAAVNDDEAMIAVVTRRDGTPTWSIATLPGSRPAVRALHALPWFAAQVEAGDVRYVHDAEAALDAVRSGAARVAYLLPPTGPGAIRAAVGSDERMPQKSTFFWPKPRTGMVLRPLETA